MELSFDALYTNLSATVEALNTAAQTETLKESAVVAAKEDVKPLNAASRAQQWLVWKNSDSPLENAIVALVYDQYKITDKTDKDTNLREFELVKFSKRINLIDFIRFCAPKTIVADPKTTCHLANFAMLLSARKAIDLGLEDEKVAELLASYRLLKKTERTQVTDRKQILTSKTSMKKELQTLVNSFIPGLKAVTDEDVSFMVDVFTAQGKENLSVRLGDPKKMADILIQVLHHLKTGKAYSVEYKTTKK